ncbi:hypothetical protein [Marinifilum flexuosum]|uniref:hypothetical protein n=1 Tax=Marinifilum flexuosum TaxID=1117708 RepID=UPI00249019BC|nr:hypothetical protein [Marinifilum flexuosum]
MIQNEGKLIQNGRKSIENGRKSIGIRRKSIENERKSRNKLGKLNHDESNSIQFVQVQKSIPKSKRDYSINCVILNGGILKNVRRRWKNTGNKMVAKAFDYLENETEKECVLK